MPRRLPHEEVVCGRRDADVCEYCRQLEVIIQRSELCADPYRSRALPACHVEGSGAAYKPLVAAQTSFPSIEEIGPLDISEHLDIGMWTALVNPRSLRSRPPRAAPWPYARRRRLGREGFEWDAAERLAMVPDYGQPAQLASDVFGVAQGPAELRQSVGRRGPSGAGDSVAGATHQETDSPRTEKALWPKSASNEFRLSDYFIRHIHRIMIRLTLLFRTFLSFKTARIMIRATRRQMEQVYSVTRVCVGSREGRRWRLRGNIQT